MSCTSTAHEANLDVIRALAVLMVVGSHLAAFCGNVQLSFLEPSLFGKLGVVIFFVHSGIVNMFSIERHVQKHGPHALFRAFMTRRCFRIYPLSVVVVLFVYLCKLPVAHLTSWTTTAGNNPRAELIPSLLLIQNFVHFDQLLGPLWSLPYEIQVYCVFPVGYLFLRRFESSRILLFAWAFLAAVDNVLGPRVLKHGNIGSFVVIPDMLSFLLLFLAGLYAYKEMTTSTRKLPFWTLPGLLLVLCGLWLLSYDRIKELFATLCLGLALPHIQESNIKVLNRGCKWIAKYSYGIYLLHIPAMWLGFVRLHHLPIVARITVFLLVTFGASALLYHVLEHPMVKLGNKLSAMIAQPVRVSAKARAIAAPA